MFNVRPVCVCMGGRGDGGGGGVALVSFECLCV